jgi:hypothetical protein
VVAVQALEHDRRPVPNSSKTRRGRPCPRRASNPSCPNACTRPRDLLARLDQAERRRSERGRRQDPVDVVERQQVGEPERVLTLVDTGSPPPRLAQEAVGVTDASGERGRREPLARSSSATEVTTPASVPSESFESFVSDRAYPCRPRRADPWRRRPAGPSRRRRGRPILRVGVVLLRLLRLGRDGSGDTVRMSSSDSVRPSVVVSSIGRLPPPVRYRIHPAGVAHLRYPGTAVANRAGSSSNRVSSSRNRSSTVVSSKVAGTRPTRRPPSCRTPGRSPRASGLPRRGGRARLPAARSWTSSARIATAISSCAILPRSSPAGAWTAGELSSDAPGRAGTRARRPPAFARRPARRTRRGGERGLQRSLVVVSLRGHDDHGAFGHVGVGELERGEHAIRARVVLGEPALVHHDRRHPRAPAIEASVPRPASGRSRPGAAAAGRVPRRPPRLPRSGRRSAR